MERAQHTFESVLIVLLLLILPCLPLGKYGGGIAMLVVSVAGLLAHFVLYGERLRSRSQVKTVAPALAVSASVATALSLLLVLSRPSS